jgi:hypothetical protein
MADPLTGAALEAANRYIEIKRHLRGPREDDTQTVKDLLTWVLTIFA